MYSVLRSTAHGCNALYVTFVPRFSVSPQIPTMDVIVEDHLGEGAFGYVFKGVIRGPLRNPKLSSQLKQTIGLPVAIKLLKGM